MAENKTKPTNASVAAFIKSIEDRQTRADLKRVSTMMRNATGAKAKMWDARMVGFGQYHYKYDSGREGDFLLTGFAPRKKGLTLYIMVGFSQFGSLMKKLGKYKTGRSCLYINRLSDVDEKVLEQLINRSVKNMRKNYETI